MYSENYYTTSKLKYLSWVILILVLHNQKHVYLFYNSLTMIEYEYVYNLYYILLLNQLSLLLREK